LAPEAAEKAVKSQKQTHLMRFRGWNPDIKTAQKMGVSIFYSGSKNEIICPELKLSSGNVQISFFYESFRLKAEDDRCLKIGFRMYAYSPFMKPHDLPG